MRKKGKIYNKMLPRKPKKSLLTTPQKVLWCLSTITVIVGYGPEAITKIYNYVNRADSTEIKLPQKEELFPTEGNQEQTKQDQEKIENANTNFSYSYLKTILRSQIEEKLGFGIEGDFDVLSVLELNLRSDSFESKDTRLCILIKPEKGGVFCVNYNNNYSQIEIEKEGAQSDAVSSLIAHLQSSSIESIEINSEFFEDTMQNLSELNMILIGGVKTYIEKNGEKSYMFPVFVKNGDQINLKTYKCLQSEIEKADLTPENALASSLYGDEDALMNEYTNQKQQDLSHLNIVLDEIKNKKSQNNEQNKDLFPDDYYEEVDCELTKG